MSKRRIEAAGRWALAFAALAGLAFVSAGMPARAQNPGDPIAIDRHGENDTLAVDLTSYRLLRTKLGEDAAAGSLFLVVRGTITNKSDERAALPPARDAFYLILADSSEARLDPLTEDTADPLWGATELVPREVCPIELVFVVSDPPPPSATLIHPSQDGVITVSVIDEGLVSAAPAEFGPAILGVTSIAATDVSHEPPPGYEAPPGRRFLTVGLRYTNLRQAAALAEFTVSDFTVLVEDGVYVYPVHAASAGIGSPLTGPHAFLPGVPIDGALVFEVPEETGDLALVHFTPDGALALDLTPELEPAAGPAPVAGPSSRGIIMFDLLAASQRPGEAAAEGRIVVLDLLLRLVVDRWDQSLAYDPNEGLELHDTQGRVYRPLASLSGLRRPLATVPLWRDQPARGEVGFEVAGDAAGLTLVIPFRGNPVQLALPDGLLPVPVAAVPAEAPEVPLTEQPAPSAAAAEEPEAPAVELPALGVVEPEEPAAERPAADQVEEEEEAAPAAEPSEDTPPLPPTPIKPRPPAAPVSASACPVPDPGKGARTVFLGEDRGTSGEWQGHYGGEGHILVS